MLQKFTISFKIASGVNFGAYLWDVKFNENSSNILRYQISQTGSTIYC